MGERRSRGLTRWMIHPVFLVASMLTMALLVAFSQQPPSALDEYTPDDQFSAFRAIDILEGLLVDSQPHVAGSPLNKEIRSRIVQQFQSFGFEPEIQSRFHCNPHFGSCANVENIIAVKPGDPGEHAVLLTAHYDGSWAGPGAADDGAGTAAIIEIARMVQALGDSRNDLVFLLTDAEEQGLIGAHAFAEHHPLFAKVRAVINLEARGVTGPSTMFETGDGNRSIVRILSKNLERPVANSLAYEVYKRMPNDTDYSVYRNRGVMGLNFAFSGGVALYHSQLDILENLDADSVQHHGQNAWSMVQALMDRDIARMNSREDAVYIDLFGRMLIIYPEDVAVGLTFLFTVVMILAIVLANKKSIRPQGIFWAMLAQVTVIAVFAGGAWLLNWPLGTLVETNPIEHPNPWAARATVFVLCVLALWIGSKLYAHRISFGEGLLVTWVGISGLAFWLDFNLIAASFLALLPLAAFFIGMLVDIIRWRSKTGLVFAGTLGFWAASYLAVYFFYQLGTIISFEYTHLVAGPIVLMLIAVLPLWFGHFREPIPDWRPGVVAAGLVLIGIIVHQFMPGFGEDRPRGMNIVYRQAAGESLIYLESPGGGVDATYADLAGLESREIPSAYSSEAIPFSVNRPVVTRFAAGTESMNLPEARVNGLGIQDDVDVTAGELRNVRFDVIPPPGSERIVVAFPNNTEIAKARVQGLLAIDGDLENKRGYTPSVLTYPFPGTDPITFEVSFKGGLPAGFNVTVRHPLPAAIWQEYQQGWPADAQPIFRGLRAEVVIATPFSAD